MPNGVVEELAYSMVLKTIAFGIEGSNPSGTTILEELTVKMYILVKNSIPLGFAMVCVAHASLACYLKFQHSPEILAWLSGIFHKVICKVSDQEFEKAKQIEDNIIITESALGNQEVAIAFKPRKEYPKSFKFLSLYK